MQSKESSNLTAFDSTLYERTGTESPVMNDQRPVIQDVARRLQAQIVSQQEEIAKLTILHYQVAYFEFYILSIVAHEV